jgi:hypothetical protein
MAGIGDMFQKIAQAFKGKSGTPDAAAAAASKKQQTPGLPTPPSQGFDFNIYMQAVQIFFNDFFGRQVPEFFKDPMPKLKNFPVWWKKQKQDEQLAYGGVLLGFVMIIVGVVLIIVI